MGGGGGALHISVITFINISEIETLMVNICSLLTKLMLQVSYL